MWNLGRHHPSDSRHVASVSLSRLHMRNLVWCPRKSHPAVSGDLASGVCRERSLDRLGRVRRQGRGAAGQAGRNGGRCSITSLLNTREL